MMQSVRGDPDPASAGTLRITRRTSADTTERANTAVPICRRDQPPRPVRRSARPPRAARELRSGRPNLNEDVAGRISMRRHNARHSACPVVGRVVVSINAAMRFWLTCGSEGRS